MSAEALLKRVQKAKDRKANWQTTYEEVSELVFPRRDTFNYQTKGEHRNGDGRIFDSTGCKAMQKFASNIQSSLVPPFEKFVEFVPGAALLGNDNETELRKQLKDVSETFFSHLFNSNFDVQVAESLLDLGIGTGALLVQKGTQGRTLDFQCVPIAQLYLEEGPHGTVGSVYREHKMPARVIEQTWEDAVIGERLRDVIENSPDKEMTFVEGTIPDRVTVTELVQGREVTREVDGYKYFVIDKANKDIIVEREQKSTPWVVFRYAVTPGEIYGRGPAMTAFADIRTINKVKELILKNASLSVGGAYTVADDGVINVNNIRIQPGALIPVASNAGGVQGPTIAALPRAGDFDVGQFVFEELRNSINDEMLADPLGPIDSPVRTATEIAFRQQELAKRTGSAFGRLQFEFITPLINRVLFLLEEQNLIDLSGFKVDGEVIAIEHKSPLAVAKTSREFTAMQQLVEVLNANFGPQIAQLVVNPAKFGEIAAKNLGATPNVLTTKEEQEQIQQVVAQLLAAQQQGGGQNG